MRKFLIFAAFFAVLNVQAVEWQWCVPVKGKVSEESGKAPEVSTPRTR